MWKSVVLCGVLLALWGCERPVVGPLPEVGSPASHMTQVVFIQDFDNGASVLVGSSGVRVGWYHDFSPYDSVRINFSAKRTTARQACDYIRVRIGPAYYVLDSLSASQEALSLLVRPTELGKNHSVALTFYTTTPDASLILSDLRVVGWKTE